MTREEFKKSIIRYKRFYGPGKFLTDPDEYELWYRVFKNKSAVVFDYAAICFTRKPTNLQKMPDLKCMIAEYVKARKVETNRMDVLREFFLEAKNAFPKELTSKDDEDVFFYLIQTDDWDMCYRRAEFLRDAILAYVRRLTKLGEFAKWKTLSEQLMYTVQLYNEGISRRELGPEDTNDIERYSRASYYWSLADRPGKH